jgi:hypothetical protein
MTERTLTRRGALKTLGAGAGAVAFLPWLSDEAQAAFAQIQAGKAPARLKVLTASQHATVEALVETIIPADERSPGAKEAQVAHYIDLLLSEAQPAVRTQWLDGLKALDAEAQKRFGKPYVRLDAAQAEELLTEISRFESAKPVAEPALDVARQDEPRPKPPQVDTLLGDVGRYETGRPLLETFFANTKQATINGYYTSQIGIHKELRYKGNQILAEFAGCQTVDGKDCPHCGQKAEA